MTSTRSTSALMAGLVDDAGLFPPTALSMSAAVHRHRADLAEGSDVLTHRFLCPASRICELRSELSSADRFLVGLIADAGTAGLAGTVAEIGGAPDLELASVEFPLARTGESEPIAGLDAALGGVTEAGVPAALPLFVEAAAMSDVDVLAPAVAARGVDRTLGLKLRCGGVRAELFPSPEMLAAAIVTAARAGVVVKATAGLHHAVRYTDPATGFVHHGYLNLLLAVADAVEGAGVDRVVSALRSTDRAVLVRRALDLDAEVVARTRQAFACYGSCSTSTPVAEAREFGLIQ
ncbi:MAG: hypothetical protein ACRDQ7_16505 [Haloechinothrix sp.]